MTVRAAGSRRLAWHGRQAGQTAPGPAPRSSLLLLAVVTVIIGIVAMHALSVGHHAPDAAHGLLSGHAETHTDDHHAQGADLLSETGPAFTMSVSAAAGCGPGCPEPAGTACVVALSLLLLIRRRRQRAHRLAHPGLTRGLGKLIVLRARRPAPRPPSLAALCVLRI